jgi:hypothetical protein
MARTIERIAKNHSGCMVRATIGVSQALECSWLTQAMHWCGWMHTQFTTESAVGVETAMSSHVHTRHAAHLESLFFSSMCKGMKKQRHAGQGSERMRLTMFA